MNESKNETVTVEPYLTSNMKPQGQVSILILNCYENYFYFYFR